MALYQSKISVKNVCLDNIHLLTPQRFSYKVLLEGILHTVPDMLKSGK